MENLGTKELETERLILRKFTLDDAKDMFNNYGSDSDTSKYLVWDTHKNIEDSISYIKDVLEKYKKDNFYCWGVVLKSDNVLIGAISVIDLDVKNHTAEVGYCYGSKWWGNGYATESFKRVIQFLFDDVGVETIYADLGLLAFTSPDPPSQPDIGAAKHLGRGDCQPLLYLPILGTAT